MGFQDEDTDNDPSAKGVLDGEASAQHKSVDDSATVALETTKKSTNKKNNKINEKGSKN